MSADKSVTAEVFPLVWTDDVASFLDWADQPVCINPITLCSEHG